MAKKNAPGRKRRGSKRSGIRAVRVPIKEAAKITSREVEQAIERKLLSTKTDVFGNSDTLVIVIEQHGNKKD